MTEREKFEAWFHSRYDGISMPPQDRSKLFTNQWASWQAVTASTQVQMAAMAAKGIELAAEAAMVYGKYNETQVPDRDLVDMQTIQEMHDLCAGIKLQIEE